MTEIKKKEIEEMENVIDDKINCPFPEDDLSCDINCKDCGGRKEKGMEIAEQLHNAGYRKVDEVRKETAKEFAEKAKNAIDNKKYKAGFSANMLWADDAKKCIDKLAEQFGAEGI